MSYLDIFKAQESDRGTDHFHELSNSTVPGVQSITAGNGGHVDIMLHERLVRGLMSFAWLWIGDGSSKQMLCPSVNIFSFPSWRW